jgi:hypothetical protein
MMLARKHNYLVILQLLSCTFLKVKLDCKYWIVLRDLVCQAHPKSCLCLSRVLRLTAVLFIARTDSTPFIVSLSMLDSCGF